MRQSQLDSLEKDFDVEIEFYDKKTVLINNVLDYIDGSITENVGVRQSRLPIKEKNNIIENNLKMNELFLDLVDVNFRLN